MKITLFISRTYGGGAERVTCNLANYLSEKGHQVEILVMAECQESYYVRPDVKITPLLKDSEKKNGAYNGLIRIARLRKYMREHKEVDRYVVMLPKTTVMMLALAGNTKAKIIASERVDPAVYSNGIKRMLRHYAKRAAGFVFQTEDARAWYGGTVRNCRTEVIPNAINPDFIRKPYEGQRIKRVVAAGRMTTQKNFDLLINAFSKVADEFPEYTLTIFGEGPERQNLEERIKKLGLEDRVSMPGHTDHMPEELEISSLYVLSSDFEGMPNALMEGMAVGLPCVSTNCPCGGPEFLIQDGVNGVLVPVGDADKMAEAMKALLIDEEKRNELGKEAMKVQKTLAPEKIYKQWEEFIVNVCEEKIG